MKFALWKYAVHALAYGFGLGLIPFAPGTFGSLIIIEAPSRDFRAWQA